MSTVQANHAKRFAFYRSPRLYRCSFLTAANCASLDFCYLVVQCKSRPLLVWTSRIPRMERQGKGRRDGQVLSWCWTFQYFWSRLHSKQPQYPPKSLLKFGKRNLPSAMKDRGVHLADLFGSKELPGSRAGHFRFFFIFSMIKNDFVAFLIKLITYFCTSPI